MQDVRLYVGYAEDCGDDFAEVAELSFDSQAQAWAACEGVEVINALLNSGFTCPSGYHPAAICETNGQHGFFYWL